VRGKEGGCGMKKVQCPTAHFQGKINFLELRMIHSVALSFGFEISLNVQGWNLSALDYLTI
jgi:hypothetical protein